MNSNIAAKKVKVSQVERYVRLDDMGNYNDSLVEDIGRGLAVDTYTDNDTTLFLNKKSLYGVLVSNIPDSVCVFEDVCEEEEEEEEDMMYRFDPVLNDWVSTDVFGEYEEEPLSYDSESETFRFGKYSFRSVLPVRIREEKVVVVENTESVSVDAKVDMTPKEWSNKASETQIEFRPVVAAPVSVQPTRTIEIGNKNIKPTLVYDNRARVRIQNGRATILGEKRNSQRNQELRKQKEKEEEKNAKISSRVRSNNHIKAPEEKKPEEKPTAVLPSSAEIEKEAEYYEYILEWVQEDVSKTYVAPATREQGGAWSTEEDILHQELVLYKHKLEETRRLLEKVRVMEAEEAKKKEAMRKAEEKKRAMRAENVEMKQEEEDVLARMIAKNVKTVAKPVKKIVKPTIALGFNFSSEVAQKIKAVEQDAQRDNTKTKMCRFTGCKLQNCAYAHTVEEFNPKMCRFDGCKYDKCEFLHPNETKEQLCLRLGYITKPVKTISIPVTSTKAAKNETARTFWSKKTEDLAKMFAEDESMRAEKERIEKVKRERADKEKMETKTAITKVLVEDTHKVEKTQMCTHFLRGKCNVENCKFAHGLDELNVKMCNASGCKFAECRFMHATETKEQYFKRMGWVREEKRVLKTMACAHGHRCNHGKACKFAHTFDELTPCMCDRRGCFSNQCRFMHSNETKIGYVQRMGWMLK
jgi:hypothetical protein